jgi:hypothetical protein
MAKKTPSRKKHQRKTADTGAALAAESSSVGFHSVIIETGNVTTETSRQL